MEKYKEREDRKKETEILRRHVHDDMNFLLLVCHDNLK